MYAKYAYAYKPFLSTPPFPMMINFLPGDQLLICCSSMSANNTSWKFTYIFLSSVFSQPIHLYLPSTAAFDFFFPGHSWKQGFYFSVNKSIKKLRLRWALYRRIVVNVQSPFLIFKESTSTLLVHLLTFLFQISKFYFILFFFLKGGEINKEN